MNAFPWNTDEPISGADVVEFVGRWIAEIPPREAEREQTDAVTREDIGAALDWAERDVQERFSVSHDDNEKAEAERDVELLARVRSLFEGTP